MNLGELSPEHADVEGYLDDLNDLLKVAETKRTVRITELDWGIGKYVTPQQQAAYHAARGADPRFAWRAAAPVHADKHRLRV